MKTLKKIGFTLSLLSLIFMANAQTPQSFKYQTVVRNAAGSIIANQNVSFRFNIRNGSSGGPVVYSETHTTLTNQFGLAVLNIGAGTPVSGTFSAIDWGNGSKFLQVEIDPAGGSAYVAMGTSQLLSVPYALYSENTAHVDDADADPENELQTLSITGNELTISDGNSVTLPSSGTGNRISDTDGNTWIDAELNSNNDSIVFTTMGMNRMTIRPNGYINVNGQMVATGFQGDGSGLTGVPGDNLGDHTATEELDMSNHRITNMVSPIDANDAATKLYVDTNGGDDLGDHTATQNIRLNGNYISNDGENEGLTIDNAGKIGINTTSPDQVLTVNGNIRSEGQVMAQYGAADNPSIRFGTGTESTGIASPYVNSVSVITNGNERLVVKHDGNVGIGTSNPQAPLHVNGSIRMVDGNQAAGRILISDANGTGVWSDPGSATNNEWHINGNDGTVSGTHFIGTTNNQDLDIRTNNIIRARISQKGQIETLNTGNSVFVGEQAGESDDLTDNKNVFIGKQAGYSNTTGGFNVANGNNALYSNTTGNFNSADGHQALYSNTTGSYNAAHGYTSLRTNTTGNNNTATGSNTLYSNTTGSSNTADGVNALRNNTTGNSNTAGGEYALYSNTSGNSNVAIGKNALYSNTVRSNIVAIGDSALFRNGVGATEDYHSINNTATGSKSLALNTIGYNNTAHGFKALQNNTTGYDNTAVGSLSLQSNTSVYNTAVGSSSLKSNTSGTMNTALGVSALLSNTTASWNTAIGSLAMSDNISGFRNVAVGVESMSNNTNGYDNTSSGYKAMFENTTGDYNTAYGFSALEKNQTGNNNVAVGYQAGQGSTLHGKSGGVFLGYQAGKNENNSNKLYIENSSSSTPLIGGDFAADEVYMNADVEVNGQLKITGGNPGANKVLMSDASGLASWSAQGGGGGVGSSMATAYMNANNMFTPHTNNCGSDAFINLFGGASVGFCMERNERPLKYWWEAVLTCLYEGKRLPELWEYLRVCPEREYLGINDLLDFELEWASNFAVPELYASSGVFPEAQIVVTAFGGSVTPQNCFMASPVSVADDEGGELEYHFRCVR